MPNEEKIEVGKIRMAYTATRAFSDTAKRAIKGNKIKVQPDVAEARLETCKACDLYRVSDGRCRKCGCFMAIKTTLIGAKCPLGEWEK